MMFLQAQLSKVGKNTWFYGKGAEVICVCLVNFLWRYLTSTVRNKHLGWTHGSLFLTLVDKSWGKKKKPLNLYSQGHGRFLWLERNSPCPNLLSTSPTHFLLYNISNQAVLFIFWSQLCWFFLIIVPHIIIKSSSCLLKNQAQELGLFSWKSQNTQCTGCR